MLELETPLNAEIVIPHMSCRPAFITFMIYVMLKPQQIPQMYDYELCNPSNEMLDFWQLCCLEMTLKIFRGMLIKLPDIHIGGHFVKALMYEVDIDAFGHYVLPEQVLVKCTRSLGDNS